MPIKNKLTEHSAVFAQDRKDMETLYYRLQLLFEYTPESVFSAYELVQALRQQDVDVEMPQEPFQGKAYKCLVLETGPVSQRIYDDILDLRADRERATGKAYMLEIKPFLTQATPANSIMRAKLEGIIPKLNAGLSGS